MPLTSFLLASSTPLPRFLILAFAASIWVLNAAVPARRLMVMSPTLLAMGSVNFFQGCFERRCEGVERLVCRGVERGTHERVSRHMADDALIGQVGHHHMPVLD